MSKFDQNATEYPKFINNPKPRCIDEMEIK